MDQSQVDINYQAVDVNQSEQNLSIPVPQQNTLDNEVPLLQQDAQQEVQQSQIYSQSIKNLKFQTIVFICIGIFKIVFGLVYFTVVNHIPSIYVITENQIWVILVSINAILLSIDQYIQFALLRKKTIINKIAVDLHHNQLLDDQSISHHSEVDDQDFFLGYQIKWLLKKKNIYIKYVGNVSFFLEQMLIIWALVTFFNNQEYCRQFTVLTYYKLGVIICGFYQYFEVYLIPVIIVSAIPLVLLYLVVNKIYQAISRCLNKRRILDMPSLTKLKFKNGNFPADSECSICLTKYKPSDDVVIVHCQGYHNFHQRCIQNWLYIKNTCPFCRQVIQ